MNEKYLKVIETLGNAIISKDIDIDLLKYENKKLKEKIKSIEEYCEFYNNKCE